MSQVQEILRGSRVTGFECCGMSGVVTKGAYVEPVPGKFNHALALMQQVNRKILGDNGEKVKNKERIICSLNTAYLKTLMGVEKLNKDQLRLKSGVIKTTLVKALAGKDIYMLTANKIALALCIDVERILN